jgi:peroxiredoxin (alkyl hydroperoxide reductase subunit C)
VFPSIAVDAISEMGDNFENIFEEAINNNKKVVLFWYPKTLHLYVQLNFTLFKMLYRNLKKKYNRNWCFLRYKRSTFCLVKYCKNNGGIEGVTYPILADTNRNLSNILGYLISNPLNTAKKLTQ